MSQKKKTQFKILTPPEDLSEIKHKIWKFQIAKVRKVLVLFVLIFLAVCGTILMLDNQTYTRARTGTMRGLRTGSYATTGMESSFWTGRMKSSGYSLRRSRTRSSA